MTQNLENKNLAGMLHQRSNNVRSINNAVTMSLLQYCCKSRCKHCPQWLQKIYQYLKFFQW